MKRSEFMRLKTIKEKDDFGVMDLNDKFLYGNAIIEQLNTKEVGDPITFYVVTGVMDSGNIMYEPFIEILEE